MATSWRVPAVAVGTLTAVVVCGAAAAAYPDDAPAGEWSRAATEAEFDDAQWHVDHLNLGRWHQEVTGSGVRIALIDTPVASDVPELADADLHDGDSVCAAGPDDDSPSPALGAVRDEASHGTAMAARIAGNGRGNGPGGRGVQGMAPGATITAFVALEELGDESISRLCEWGERESVTDLLRSALESDPDIISLSMRGFQDAYDGESGDWEWMDLLTQAVLEDQVIIVNSQGNSGAEALPGGGYALDGGVRAHALAPGDAFWASNSSGAQPMEMRDERGQFVDDHPGEQWLVEDAENGIAPDPYVHDRGRPAIGTHTHMTISGAIVNGEWSSALVAPGSTSASAAQVSGLLALALERWPEATPHQILQSLVRNAERPDDVLYDLRRGFGAVDLDALLTIDPTQYPDFHPTYGGLRWAFDDDPPPVMHPVETDEIFWQWLPTYSQEELDAGFPRGPAREELYEDYYAEHFEGVDDDVHGTEHGEPGSGSPSTEEPDDPPTEQSSEGAGKAAQSGEVTESHSRGVTPVWMTVLGLVAIAGVLAAVVLVRRARSSGDGPGGADKEELT
ncbi:S8/S53 family peptidase [Bogoriella caseilytica]|uniref:Subtilase family protein n=1 Tax=Bogoriella caseilytica TaxID=56055 RepID=A0A3N2BFY1_9MICO|nr:S8/S53 family peptidase [Bogoriella caseilytica]ROR74179.1 subtilase family protein [Bogoriella caseilytica]